MKELTTRELKEVNAGGVGTALLIIAGVIFLIGVIDGYIRPLKCN